MARSSGEKAKPAVQKRSAGMVLEDPFLSVNKLDFKNLQVEWGKLIQQTHPRISDRLLKINTRVKSLDPLAKRALAVLDNQFAADEGALRKLVMDNGWATELSRVTKRLNAMRISENKRLILSQVYSALLQTLLSAESAGSKLKDDIGFSSEILFELEKEGGPLDVFARELVRQVGRKHRIDLADEEHGCNVLCDLVAHQVRTSL
jgi:hypothetical protein